MEPSSGHFSVDGISSKHPEKIRRKIGVLPENLGFPKHVTGIEYLTYFGRLYGRTASEARAHGQALLEELGLRQRTKSLVGSYSHGMRQRLGIARALINDPAVVFLDEPTLGLDPRGQQELLDLVRRIARERNVGVILCSHALAEIESVCDDVVILSSGQVVAAGSVAEVIGRTRQDSTQTSVIQIRVPPPSVAEAQQVLAAMPNVVAVTPTGETTGWLRVELEELTWSPLRSADQASSEDYYTNNRILEALIRAEIPILSFEAKGGRLQDVFLHLTEETIK
jgi:ABC-2 type transport system ATP-binding protein